jgi:hypothetical protein
VPAHLTLFHHLPPSVGDELHRRLKAEAADMPVPAARITGLLDLDGGVALRVQSDGLAMLRARLAEAFAGLLMPQDQAGWRPHVTIQNKVDRAIAKALHAELSATLRLPRPLAIGGVASWRYLGGSWERLRVYRF